MSPEEYGVLKEIQDASIVSDEEGEEDLNIEEEDDFNAMKNKKKNAEKEQKKLITYGIIGVLAFVVLIMVMKLFSKNTENKEFKKKRN